MKPLLLHHAFVAAAALGLLAAPLAAVAAGNDMLYVSFSSSSTPGFGGASDRIEAFSPTGVDLGAFATAASGLSGPEGLAFDSAGNLFVANSGNRTIEKFNPAGVGTVFVNGSGAFQPEGLAFDQAGNLFVSDYTSNNNSGNIFKFNSAGVGGAFGRTNAPTDPTGSARLCRRKK